MTERPQDQIDVNELLASFAAENAKMTQRAVVAEARCVAKDRIIDALAEQLTEANTKLEAQEALLTEHAAEPDPEPGLGVELAGPESF